MFGIGTGEMVILGIIGLLLFGKRLPEVARSLGKGMVEFKKGMAGIEDEVRSATRSTPSYASSPSRPKVDVDEPQDKWDAPKFELPTSEPKEASESKEAV
ncbi:Sec-independent protein translocase subunit TatA/TatB [Planctomicrobium sp. SH664]|uniref:Sec-independent protein translocase subunit TatA/TatB n=1 Tax=Planctomicrobium sp. SH664 TaxID=3448125 RepID=UPI003F5BFFAF